MADALTFELSKLERTDIRARMIGHLRHIDEGLAQEVADGLGLDALPDKVEPACEPITDLPPSPGAFDREERGGQLRGPQAGHLCCRRGRCRCGEGAQGGGPGGRGGGGDRRPAIAPHVGR